MINNPINRELRSDEIMIRVIYPGIEEGSGGRIACLTELILFRHHEYTVTEEKRTGAELAEIAWRKLQANDPYEGSLNHRFRIRSCDMGDIIEVHWSATNVQKFVVVADGMAEVTTEEAERIKSMSFLERWTYGLQTEGK